MTARRPRLYVRFNAEQPGPSRRELFVGLAFWAAMAAIGWLVAAMRWQP